MANILIRHDRAHAYVRCRCETEGHDCCLEQRRDTPCDASINYLTGRKPPNYPVPAIRTMRDNARRLIAFGEISAENGFCIETVFDRFVK